MGSRGFSLAAALKSGAGFVPRGAGAAWVALALVWALSLVVSDSVTARLGIHAAQPVLLGLLALLVLMAEGALYRKALFGGYAKAEGLGWGGLQFGRPELRLIGAAILVALFIAFIAALLGLVIALVLNVAGLTTTEMNLPHDLLRYHGKATIAVVAAFMFCLIFLTYLSFRLSLYKAATIDQHQVVSLNALGYSGGQAFKLFLGVFILSLPVTLGIALFMSPYVFEMGGEVSRHLHPESLDVLKGIGFGLLAQGALKFIAVFVVMPAICGFFASAYGQTVGLRGKETQPH